MVHNLVLQADWLQAELIVSDIPHSGKAYLRGLARLPNDAAPTADATPAPAAGVISAVDAAPAAGAVPAAVAVPATAPDGIAGRPDVPVTLEAELASLIETARRLAESLGGQTLMAGFRPDGPLPQLTPENPPPGMHHYTSFVRLTAEPAALAAAPGEPAAQAPLATASPESAAAPASPAQAWRRVRLSPERIGTFLALHRFGLAGVPNVPTLSETDARDLLTTSQVDLIERADQTENGTGETAIGFINISIDAAAGTAELEEIAFLPPWRGQGIGRTVIRAVARELAEAGIHALGVVVATANRGALRLYESIGFGSSELFAHWFQMPAKRFEPIAPIHTQAELAADLRRLGVRPGETLLVHSSLKRLGWVPGGAVALIAALTEALGPDGTLVMPAHSGENSDPAHWVAPPVPAEWWPVIREAYPAYQPDVTPSFRIGHVAEVFRTQPGVLRSGHPSHSFTARGPRAAEIMADHPLAGGLGDASPLGKLVRTNARVLQIGTDYDSCTIMHLGERQAGCRLREKQGAAMMSEGRRQWVAYDDEHVNSDEFAGPGQLLESRGQVLTGQVGEAPCRLFDAADAVAAARDWFRENRMHRLGEADRGWLMDLLRREPEFNLFLIGDVENYGFDEPYQDILAFHRPLGTATAPAVDSIVLRYYTNFIVYSEHDDFALEPVLSALDYPTLGMLSAKQTVMARLRPQLPGYRFTDSFMMKRPTIPAAPAAAGFESASGKDNSDFVPGTKSEVAKREAGRAPRPEDPPIALATLDDVPELAAFLFGVAEFAVANQTLEDKTSAMRRSLVNAGTRYVIIRENGRIVACAGTTAENSQSAMVVSVATDPACRRRGHATRLVSRLCELHAREGREFLCLFYTNPNAGIIYRGLGFAEIGTWVMARPPVRLPKAGV